MFSFFNNTEEIVLQKKIDNALKINTSLPVRDVNRIAAQLEPAKLNLVVKYVETKKSSITDMMTKIYNEVQTLLNLSNNEIIEKMDYLAEKILLNKNYAPSREEFKIDDQASLSKLHIKGEEYLNLLQAHCRTDTLLNILKTHPHHPQPKADNWQQSYCTIL